MDTNGAAGITAEVSRVGIRVPPFFPANPQLWFAQLEAQFHLNGITTDNTKYWYVMSGLDARYAEEVMDIITNPPAEGKYDTLKKELIARLSVSQERKTRQLLEHEEIGDRTPSQFLRHLRGLAGEAMPDALLRTLWTSRLPKHMHPILATLTDVPLDKVAISADRMHEATAPPQVARVDASFALEELRQELHEIRQQLRGRSRD